MIISTNWLADYVQVGVPTEKLVERLLMSGLNHESTRTVGGDTALEVEVTSNRPDCLGHVGIAREASVLFSRPLHIPDPRPLEGSGRAEKSMAVEIRSPDVCPFYSARVIRGVRVGSSPAWLVERLATVGVESVNNIVDVTNYVMLECGQPLHAFDLAKIRGGRLVVRRAGAGEAFTAINHKTYSLTEQMCVIADAVGPVALAGVMGGAESEISAATVDVLLESAQFAPLAVRAAARGLSLASASSYRFERTPDPAAVEWASLRAAAIILDIAGGTLERGAVAAGLLSCSPATIVLRHPRVAEVLGVEIPAERQHAILSGLGFADMGSGETRRNAESSRWLAPTWRRDCWREIDLVEEIARIEGYESVPEDKSVTARPVELSNRERAIRTASSVLVAAGMCEAMTRSVVTAQMESAASPWGTSPPLVVSPALVRGADRLRRTLLPSLLEARAVNLAMAAPHGELFEIARAYIGRTTAEPAASPVEEPLLVSLVTGGTFAAAKGLAEAVLSRFGITATFRPIELDLFARGRAAEILRGGHGGHPERIGVVGEFSKAVLERSGPDAPVAGAELRLDRIEQSIGTPKTLRRPSDFPAVERDVNLVVDRAVPWGDIDAVIHQAAGDLLEHARLVQVWTDTERLGPGKKSMVVSLRLRSGAGTLSSDEANRAVAAIVAACEKKVGAVLRK